MKFMRGTAFELDKAQQKEAQLDVEKIKEELVAELKKRLAEMIRDAFMKKVVVGGSGGDGKEMKISLSNFKAQQPATDQGPEAAKPINTDDVNAAAVVPEDAEMKAEAPAPAQAPSLDDLAESQVSLFSDADGGDNEENADQNALN